MYVCFRPKADIQNSGPYKIMTKDEFKTALRKKLRETPLKTRKTWDKSSLLGWWGQAQEEDSYLVWKGHTGSVWQHVKLMCDDLIGNNAIE